MTRGYDDKGDVAAGHQLKKLVQYFQLNMTQNVDFTCKVKMSDEKLEPDTQADISRAASSKEIEAALVS